jgi:CheY-like chemotaxis protein
MSSKGRSARGTAMRAIRWNDPDAFDDTLLLASADDAHRRVMKDGFSRVRGRRRSAALGSYPRFRILTTSTGPEALRRAPEATIAAVNLALPKGPGLETIREMRESHAEIAILAYATSAGASDAMAAVMAGADFFYDCHDESSAELARAVDLAIDRRRLTHTIEKSEAEVEEARGKLAQLSGDLVGTVPGLWPLHSREAILPFREAARRYLLTAAGFYARDPVGLAKALGVSYFALRRLLARYEVPVPSARPRR